MGKRQSGAGARAKHRLRGVQLGYCGPTGQRSTTAPVASQSSAQSQHAVDMDRIHKLNCATVARSKWVRAKAAKLLAEQSRLAEVRSPARVTICTMAEARIVAAQVPALIQTEVAHHTYLTSNVAHRAETVAGMVAASGRRSSAFAATLEKLLPDVHALRTAQGVEAGRLHASIRAQLHGAAAEAQHIDTDRAALVRSMREQASLIRGSAAVMGGAEWIRLSCKM